MSECASQYNNNMHSRLTLFVLAVFLILFVPPLFVEDSILQALAIHEQNSTSPGNNLTDLLPTPNRNTSVATQDKELTAGVPRTLTVDMPLTTNEIKMTLAAVVNSEKQIKQEVSTATDLFAINEWNPLFTFQLREGSKIGLVDVKQALLGKVKSYDSYNDVLSNSTLWKNIPLNEEVILNLKDRGIHLLVAEVQFADGISGIYASRLNST
jgi:hypothetical protein